MKRAVRALRVIGLVEGVSFLLLLGVAMPLKYAAGMPGAVTVVGWAHGLLFIALWAAAGWAWKKGLSENLAGLTLVASVLPGGPFVLDRWLKRAEEGADGGDGEGGEDGEAGERRVEPGG
ncbi:MAG: DUF3817 domain-containing protein [Planctomycetota bacterium]